MELLTVGESFEDLVFHSLPRLPVAGESVKTDFFTRSFGGGAFISAVAAARLGTSGGISSGLSTAAARRLEDEGVRVQNLRLPDEVAALNVSLSTPRERARITYNGVNAVLEARVMRAARDARARHVHFALTPSDCVVWIEVIESLRQRGMSTSFDFGWADDLPRRRGFQRLVGVVDLVFMSEREALRCAQARNLGGACGWLRQSARAVVIKLGERGARWIRGDDDVPSPGHTVSVTDTTGAGDAFNGAFLHAWLRGYPSAECLYVANQIGGESVRAAGALEGLPRFYDRFPQTP